MVRYCGANKKPIYSVKILGNSDMWRIIFEFISVVLQVWKSKRAAPVVTAAVGVVEQLAKTDNVAQTIPVAVTPTVNVNDEQGTKQMSLNILEAGQALATIEQLDANATSLYNYAIALANQAETTYAAQTSAGASKKAAVMAVVGAMAQKLGTDWTTLQPQVSTLIDNAVAAVNVAKTLGL
jgi:hypothetical protein